MRSIKSRKGVPRACQKFKKTEEQAKKIKTLGGFGMTWTQISKLEGVPERTLQKHYQKEFDLGKAEALGAVTNTLFRMAVSGNNPAATFFWLKCQGRWKEVHHVEMKTTDETPVKDLSDKELSKIVKEDGEK